MLCTTHATGLAVRSHTAAIAVGLTRFRVDRDCGGAPQVAGLTKPANAYFGSLIDWFHLGEDAKFSFESIKRALRQPPVTSILQIEACKYQYPYTILNEMKSGSSPTSPSPNGSSAQSSSRIIGTGEMADRVRAYDWSTTPLGPIESWSRELLTVVNLTLSFSSPARTMWGPDLILIYNDAYRPVPGPRHPWALGKAAKMVYGESWPVVGPLLENAYATGQTLFHEKLLVPLPTETGMQDHYLNYSFNPIFEDGKIAGLFGPLHDVTSDVLAERQLRESEDRLARVLKSIGDAVIVTDAQTNITRMNPVAERLTGWTIAEAQGQPLAKVFRIVNETTRQTVESPADKVKRTGSIVGLANHTVLISKDGKDTAIDDSGAPIFDEHGELSGIVLVFRDITEKRAAQREKDRLAERLSQFLGATTDAIVGMDRNWVMTYLNPKAAELYASDREILGQVVWEAFPDAADEGSPFFNHFTRAMNDRIPGGFEAVLLFFVRFNSTRKLEEIVAEIFCLIVREEG